MSDFPGSPRVLKGAIVGVDPLNPVASVIVFQYNPHTLTRRLQPRLPEQDRGRAEPLRLGGPPTEDITVEIEIDAADQLERGDQVAGDVGIHPQLAALEMLIYPKTAAVIANLALLAAGTLEVVAPEAPLTLFIWGAARVLPVRISSFSITEEAHDPALNPTRARVSLGLRVLSYADLPITHAGHALFVAHSAAKEVLAVTGSAPGLSAAGVDLPGL